MSSGGFRLRDAFSVAPDGGLVVAGAGLEASVQDAGQAARQSSEGVVVLKSLGVLGVVERAGTGRDPQRGEGLDHQRVDQPVVAHEPGGDDLRAPPYLYTDCEVAALIAAASSFRFPLRTATYQVLIGLLAVIGMRVGEAIAPDRGDTDLDAGMLTVRSGKHVKSPLVPVHDSTARALRDYLRLRDRLCPDACTSAALVSAAGTRLLYLQRPRHLEEARRLRRTPGPVGNLPAIHPRPAALIAVRTVLDAYESGLDHPDRHARAGRARGRKLRMGFGLSGKAKYARERMLAFMVGEIFPAEKAWREYLQKHGAHAYRPVVEELKASAQRRGPVELGLSRCETTGQYSTRDEGV
jgi:hypothetical protein